MCGPAILIQWFYNLRIADRRGQWLASSPGSLRDSDRTVVDKKFLVQLEVSYFKCMPTINVTVSSSLSKPSLVVASSFQDLKNDTHMGLPSHILLHD